MLGDLPLVGRLFKSKAEEHFKRNLMVFVTARLIDPAGKPVNDFTGDEMTAPTPGMPATPAVEGNINPALLDGGEALPTL